MIIIMLDLKGVTLLKSEINYKKECEAWKK